MVGISNYGIEGRQTNWQEIVQDSLQASKRGVVGLRDLLNTPLGPRSG